MPARRFCTLGVLLALFATSWFAAAAQADVFSDPVGPDATTQGSPTIVSDKADYGPGETVVLTGGGWQPGESVLIVVNDDGLNPEQPWQRDVTVTADDQGGIVDTFQLPEWFVANYTVDATGSAGGLAHTSFTDGNASFAPSRFPLAAGTFTNVSPGGFYSVTSTATKQGGGTNPTLSSWTANAPGNVCGSGVTTMPASWLTLTSGTLPKEITDTTSEPYTFAVTVPAAAAAGNYGAQIAFASTGGGGGGTFTICTTVVGKANQTVTLTAPASKTYGDSDFTVSASSTSLLTTFNYSTSGGCTNSGATIHITAAADCQVTATQPGDASFNPGSDSKTITINKKTVVPGFTADGKVYDGTTAATISTRSLSGLLPADSSVTFGGGSATFATAAVGTGKTVTWSGFALSGSGSGNYELSATTATTTADITPKLVTGSFTASNKVYDGTTSATILSRSLTGVVGSDDVSLSGGTAAFATRTVGSNKTVNGSGFSLTGTAAGNYAVGSSNLTSAADITPKTVTLSFSAADKVYDGNTSATVLATVNGAVAGDSVSATGGSASFDTKNVGHLKTVSASGYSLSGADAPNYSLSSGAGTTTADIFARSVSGAFTASNKAYDGTTVASIASRSLNGVLSGDTVSLTGGSASFDDKNARTNKTVTGTGFTLDGADKDNYSLASSVLTTTADISRTTVHGSFTATSKTYDGNTDASIATRSLEATDIVGNEDVTLEDGSASFESAAAGDNKLVTATGFTLGGADSSNYELASTTLTTHADINKALLTVTASSPADLTYGDPKPAVEPEYAGFVAGEGTAQLDHAPTCDTAYTAGADVGTYTTSCSGGDDGNYDFSYVDGSFKVTRAASSIALTWNDSIYDGHSNAASAPVTGVHDASLGDAALTYYAGPTATGTPLGAAPKDAGTYTVTASFAGNNNYNPASQTKSITIGKATLHVDADDAAKTYGAAEPTPGYSLSEFASGENASVAGVTGDPNCFVIPHPEAVGEYPDTTSCAPGSLVAANYQFVPGSKGKLTINRAPLTANVSDETMTYGDSSIPAFHVTGYNGLTNGDTDSVVTGSLSCDSASHDAGTHSVTCSGLSASNYTLSYHGGSLTVNKATLSVNAADKSKTYGDPDPTPTWTYSGFKGSDNSGNTTINGNAVCSIAAHPNDAGQYPDVITCAPGDLNAANYAFATGSKGKLTIGKADQTISMSISTKTLGTTFDPGATASSGLPVSYAAAPASVCVIDSGNVKTVGVGQCKVTASQGGNGNFNAAPSVDSTFNVIYRWDGFLQPVNDTAHTGGYESKFKTGSTVPLKFQVKNALGTSLQQLTAPTFSRGSNRGSCDAYTNTETVTADTPTAGAEYRWDASAQQYIYNFSTKGLTAGEYRVYAGLGDGVTYSVDICLTK